MARKGHRKSKLGCIECKRRHVKCDETRPICRKCEFSNRDCAYEGASSEQSPTSHTPTFPQPQSRSPWHSEQHSSPGERRSIQPETRSPASPSVSGITSDVNLDHLKLLYHYEHETCKTVARTDEQIDTFRRLIVRRAIERPFLLEAIFALSALHLSLQGSPKSSRYQDAAAVWQSRALQDFHTIFPHLIDETNVLDILLFQHVIGLHVFCDVFMAVNDDFSTFIERLCSCIRLLRGINTVIQTWWNTLAQTEIGHIMLSSHIHQQNIPHPSRRQCERLLELVAQADLRAQSIAVCQESVSNLQLYIDAEDALNEASSQSTNMLFAWLVTLSSEFVALLEQRKPEALIILAHYAVLLHSRRRSWVVGNSGRQLLDRVDAYLGKSWEEWLEWPRTVVSSSTIAATTPNDLG